MSTRDLPSLLHIPKCNEEIRLYVVFFVKKRLHVGLILFYSLFLKDFGFVVNFVKSSKSEIQYDIHKIYSHSIETQPSKLETQHGVRATLRDYLFENVTIFRKDFSFVVNFVNSSMS